MITPEDKAAAEAYCADHEDVRNEPLPEKAFSNQSIDAREWAAEWMRVIKEHPDVPTDEGTMVTWFANSIMAGYDEARRRSERENAELRAKMANAHMILDNAEHTMSITAHKLVVARKAITDALKELSK